jgi:hypothetical protein
MWERLTLPMGFNTMFALLTPPTSPQASEQIPYLVRQLL